MYFNLHVDYRPRKVKLSNLQYQSDSSLFMEGGVNPVLTNV